MTSCVSCITWLFTNPGYLMQLWLYYAVITWCCCQRPSAEGWRSCMHLIQLAMPFVFGLSLHLHAWFVFGIHCWYLTCFVWMWLALHILLALLVFGLQCLYVAWFVCLAFVVHVCTWLLCWHLAALLALGLQKSTVGLLSFLLFAQFALGHRNLTVWDGNQRI